MKSVCCPRKLVSDEKESEGAPAGGGAWRTRRVGAVLWQSVEVPAPRCKGPSAGVWQLEWRAPGDAVLTWRRMRILFYFPYCQNRICSGEPRLTERQEQEAMVDISVQGEAKRCVCSHIVPKMRWSLSLKCVPGWVLLCFVCFFFLPNTLNLYSAKINLLLDSSIKGDGRRWVRKLLFFFWNKQTPQQNTLKLWGTYQFWFY